MSLVSPALASGFFSTGLPGKAQKIEHSPSLKKKKEKESKKREENMQLREIHITSSGIFFFFKLLQYQTTVFVKQS